MVKLGLYGVIKNIIFPFKDVGRWLKASINSRVSLVESIEGMVNSVSFKLASAKENEMNE